MALDDNNSNVIYLRDILKPSKLEKQYVKLYGQEFVDDLKHAYYWMRADMLNQLPKEEVASTRRKSSLGKGNYKTVFYVDFRNEDLYSQTIDDFGGKTIHNWGKSPILNIDTDHNIRYLLSGMFFYDKDKTGKWLKNLLGEGEKFWYEKG